MPGKGVKNGMKKQGSILSLLCVLVLSCTFFVSCKDRSQELNQVDYEVGVYSDKNWEESVGTYQGDAIPDEETALAVAQGIFQGIEKSQAAEQYRPQVVFYDQEDEIWIVSFWQDSGQATLGNDCSIALQKKDGKVLRIWFGE